ARASRAVAHVLPVLRRHGVGGLEPGGNGCALRSPVGDREHPRLRMVVCEGVVLAPSGRAAGQGRAARVLVHALVLHELVLAFFPEGADEAGGDRISANPGIENRESVIEPVIDFRFPPDLKNEGPDSCPALSESCRRKCARGLSSMNYFFSPTTSLFSTLLTPEVSLANL